jgi:8-oxo-dGTP pyrophosphatase MutT (NUDIX family)
VAEAWTGAPTPSATVLLVRDAEDEAGDPTGGLEVLLLERVLRSDFAGGALVFPGGKVDAADADLPADRWRGPDPELDAEELGFEDPGTALATRAAAVRETFEEAGVLLATRSDGSPLRGTDLRSASFLAARAALIDHGPVTDFHAWLDDEDLVLDLAALGFWSWWVTPEGQHRRYDTRFFVARVPDTQRHAAAHDEVETTSAHWMTPEAALSAAETGEATIIFPTRWNLRELAAFASASAAVDAALTGATDTERTLPTVVVRDGAPLVQHPRRGAPEPI